MKDLYSCHASGGGEGGGGHDAARSGNCMPRCSESVLEGEFSKIEAALFFFLFITKNTKWYLHLHTAHCGVADHVRVQVNFSPISYQNAPSLPSQFEKSFFYIVFRCLCFADLFIFHPKCSFSLKYFWHLMHPYRRLWSPRGREDEAARRWVRRKKKRNATWVTRSSQMCLQGYVQFLAPPPKTKWLPSVSREWTASCVFVLRKTVSIQIWYKNNNNNNNNMINISTCRKKQQQQNQPHTGFTSISASCDIQEKLSGNREWNESFHITRVPTYTWPFKGVVSVWRYPNKLARKIYKYTAHGTKK